MTPILSDMIVVLRMSYWMRLQVAASSLWMLNAAA